MIESGQAPKSSKVVIFGLTFKENCPDIRNSKVADIIERLREYGIEPAVVDPWADKAEARQEYGIELFHLDDIQDADCILFTVAHDSFKQIALADLQAHFKAVSPNQLVLIDVKGLFTVSDLKASGLNYWRL